MQVFSRFPTALDGESRLWVGVTGHRNVDNEDPRLRATVLEQLRRLENEIPGRPMVLVSCLAEGADRLVAMLAVDHCGAELVAPLPLPPDDYKADFTGNGSRDQFDQMLGQAVRWFVVRDSAARSGSSPAEDRRRRYACAGAWIVEHCHVLIALWDGQPVRGTGGTGEVVEWMVKGGAPPEYAIGRQRLHAAPDLRRVIHIDPATYEVKILGAANLFRE